MRLYSGITGETAGEYSEVGLDGTVTVIDRLPHADQPWYTRTRSFDRNGTCAMATPLAGVDYSSYATIGSVGGCIAVMAITDPNASFRQFVYEYLVGIAPAKPVQVTYPNLQAVLYKP